jgi:hypothetical protein
MASGCLTDAREVLIRTRLDANRSRIWSSAIGACRAADQRLRRAFVSWYGPAGLRPITREGAQPARQPPPVEASQ